MFLSFVRKSSAFFNSINLESSSVDKFIKSSPIDFNIKSLFVKVIIKSIDFGINLAFVRENYNIKKNIYLYDFKHFFKILTLKKQNKILHGFRRIS